jgi:sulfur relay (sulfurtransferase) DsrC/TusE family protein
MRVPISIPECFQILDAVVDDISIDMIRNKREGELVDCHFELGMFIRNNWLYDQTSPFVQYLRSQGLSWMQEDDVSGFLIKLYWEYLNGKLFDDEGFAERFVEEVTPGYC